MFERIAVLLEIVGGARAAPERWRENGFYPLARALLWVALLLLAAAFAGRTSKFVYVDF